MLKNANPAMRPFEEPQTWDSAFGTGVTAKPTTMTLGGVVQATAIQLGCAVAGAAIAWTLVARGLIPPYSAFTGLGIFALLFIGGMFMARKPQLAVVLGPIFSALYGSVAGMMSYMVAIAIGAQIAANAPLFGAAEGITAEQAVQHGAGIIFQAMLLTMGVVAAVLIATITGILRVTGALAKVVIFATIAVMATYVVSMVLNLLGSGIPFIHSTGPIGIGFSIFVVVLASLNLSMQFTTVQTGIQQRMPRYMEWYAGYALVSVIVWLYIEILWLLYKIYASRN